MNSFNIFLLLPILFDNTINKTTKDIKMIKINAMDHLNMNVKSLNDTMAFYKDVFGFKTYEEGNYSDTPYAIIGKQGSMFLCIYEVKNFVATKGDISHVGFHINNYDEIEQILEKNNITIKAKYDYPKSKSIYINDPSGHEIELSSQFGGGF
jgi:catechol-2,3-dioxygenase